MKYSFFQILIGLFSNLVVFAPVVLCMLLFNQGAAWKRGKSRFDIATDKAEEEGAFNKPKKSIKAQYSDEILR